MLVLPETSKLSEGSEELELLAPGTCRDSCPGVCARASVCVSVCTCSSVEFRPPQSCPRGGLGGLGSQSPQLLVLALYGGSLAHDPRHFHIRPASSSG